MLKDEEKDEESDTKVETDDNVSNSAVASLKPKEKTRSLRKKFVAFISTRLAWVRHRKDKMNVNSSARPHYMQLRQNEYWSSDETGMTSPNISDESDDEMRARDFSSSINSSHNREDSQIGRAHV